MDQILWLIIAIDNEPVGPYFVTIYRRIRIGRDDRVYQSAEAYDISYLVH